MEPEEGGERECRVVEMRWKARWNVRGVGLEGDFDVGMGFSVGVGVRASLFAFASFRRMASIKPRAYRLSVTLCSNEGEVRKVCPPRASVNATTVNPISA